MGSYLKKRTVSVVVLSLAAISVSLFFGLGGREAVSQRFKNRNTLMMIQTLNETVRLAEKNFYEEVDREKLYEGAIQGALAALGDPYSFYQSPQEQQYEQETLIRGKFGGLGITIYEDNGLVKIARPLPNTPAMRAGLNAGDYIIKVESEPVNIGGTTGVTLNDVVSKIRGEINTDITITIQRRSVEKPFDVTLTRAEIKISSVEQAIIDEEIGYIRLNRFTGLTNKEFHEAMQTFFPNDRIGDVKSLILDLRYNPGGLLISANAVTDAFLSGGLIVSTKGRLTQFNREHRATSRTLCPPEVDVIVLINEYSASGSEIVAGALKDHQRAVLIGEKTYGKGVVQQRFSLENGGAISLTISTYYTPNDVSINRKGIEPHIQVEPLQLETEVAQMRQKMRLGKYVNKFVMKWIGEEETRIGSVPQDFLLFSLKLPELMQELAQNEIQLSEELVKLEAERIFNANVGIYRLIDRENDRQLQEAIQLIMAGQVQKTMKERAIKPESEEGSGFKF